MTNISENILKIKKEIPENVTLVAVSKTKPNEDILEAYNTGQRIFGENKVQELVEKYEKLPKDIQWHLIGHLQTNKVKYIAPFVSLIHAVDSIKLLKEINKRALQNNRVIDCLIQIHIADEDSKFGVFPSDLDSFLEEIATLELRNVNIVGFMGMATFTDNTDKIRNEFSTLKHLFDKYKSEKIKILSMGMSNDYKIAIQEGSTMVRVGSSIFGKRNY